ncbi:MAG TPA: LysM peptidoglycan-binding domain-containing protein [Geobacteraceae bacterium]
MSRRFLAIAALAVTVLSGCASTPPRWRQDAMIVLDAARLEGADKAFPAEYGSARDTFDRGEALLSGHEVADAETFYHFALLKGQLLEQNFAADKVRRAEEARRTILEEKREAERQRALLDEQRRAVQEKVRAAEAESKAKVEKPRQQPKERPLPNYHTVKRGETLPQIAAMSDVYNDYRLWPLLYRANRDQISDPRHIWPGQVLRIPRNLSRDEIGEARRYALEKPI